MISRAPIDSLFVLFAAAGSLFAANPYLNLESGEPVVGQWSGNEWGDRIDAAGEEGRPLSATVTTRRLAQMPWGQIVRMRFEVDGEREIGPLYLLVRDELILELVSDDIEYVIGVVAAMKKAPEYETTDVRALSAEGSQKAQAGPAEVSLETGGGGSSYMWSHPSGHFRKLVWLAGEGLIEYAAGSGARQDGFRLAPTGPEDILANEKLGELALGMPEGEVLKILGGSVSSTKPVLAEATGEWMKDRSWPDMGLELSMSSAAKVGPWALGSITAKAPCRLATAGGIRVGSFEADVKKAYGKVHSAEDSVAGECFVAGSIYGGLIFDLKEGVVTRIFIGAAAE